MGKTKKGLETNPVKTSKRSCQFNAILQKDYPFLRKIDGKADRVKCMHCLSEFSISHGGRNDIKAHIGTQTHMNGCLAVAGSGSSKMTTYFKTTEHTDIELGIAAKECTFAFHTAIHNISFKTSDCSGKLISKFFEPKFTLARTKCEAVILNVIVPKSVNDLKIELKNCTFVTVSTDASNRKDVKIVPYIVRYFVPTIGVQVKLLDINSVPGETAEILTQNFMSMLQKHELTEKLAGFCADNCNTNFGGVLRKGQKNVFYNLRNEIGREIIGIGCGAHIVHNCLQTAVDLLPIDVEALVVKIYKFFYIYTVRVTKLKEFCEFVETGYKKVLKHGNTRFLSLLPAIERILFIFEGLKSYFLSQDNCPKMIFDFFSSDYGEMYLWFVHGQLALFNKTILSMEKEEASATDVSLQLIKLKSNLVERRDCKFVPPGAKKILSKLGDPSTVFCKTQHEILMF